MADVLVVGGGAPGLAAPVEVAAAAATVRVLDAGTKVGGTSGMSAGVFYAARTSLRRRRRGLARCESRYYMTFNR
jgi:fumarate reductase flavoprotein subunit